MKVKKLKFGWDVEYQSFIYWVRYFIDDGRIFACRISTEGKDPLKDKEQTINSLLEISPVAGIGYIENMAFCRTELTKQVDSFIKYHSRELQS